MQFNTLISYIWGSLMSINFVIFWAFPIGFMGASWKYFFRPFLFPIYDWIDKNESLRTFAVNYIYSKPTGADYFATSILLIFSCLISLSTVFYWQIKFGSLPWWLLVCYYCSWVGVGGRIMGAAYTLAHREVNIIFYLLQ